MGRARGERVVQTSTSSIPNRNTIEVRTTTIDFIIHERDYGQDGSTELSINNHQVELEFYRDGRVWITDGIPGGVCVEYESLEDFIDLMLRNGDRL
jgi:hypothetical protein